jgi:TetR/AcrR family transcriptional regulator, transcriptional repressor for nem operon
VRARIKQLESSLAPKDAIRTLLEQVIERSLADRARGGCLLINSALEVAPHDRQLGAEIAARLGEIEAFFRRSIAAVQKDGTVPRRQKPGDLAHLLLGVLLGIRVLARSKPDRNLLEGVARPALAALD